MAQKYQLPKSERLCSEKLIQKIFKDGETAFVYPFRAVFIVLDNSGQPFQVLFSTSRKKHKNAVDRNRIKRLMREAYRYEISTYKQKPLKKHYAVAFIYVADTVLDFAVFQRSMQKILQKIVRRFD